MKVLSKSRFKLGLECPNKLYYTSKNELYANQKNEDPFLQALAEGGFQVEELARLQYPGGQMITERKYLPSVADTASELQKENVVLYEAAFLFDSLYVRTDIFVKQGNKIKLIEVKAKSFDGTDDYFFIGKKGGLQKSWLPYLFDIAFQKHVVQKAFPEFEVEAFLLMPDKNKTAKVDGLNQMIRVPSLNTGGRDPRNEVVVKISTIEEIGESVLNEVPVDFVVDPIIKGEHKHNDLPFLDWVEILKEKYCADEFFNYPPSFTVCKSCEFTATQEEELQGKLSGFKNCFKKLCQWEDEDFKRPNIMEISNFVGGQKLFDEQRYFMDELIEEDFVNSKDKIFDKMPNKFRQWIQIVKAVDKDESVYVLQDELKSVMDKWVFPLHFIDFETNMLALPFHKDRKPYEQIAFQYSHHTLYEDGSIVHSSEYINCEPGHFPNFDFVRALKKDLEKDSGTIFRYANHENMVLNQIYVQLMESNEADKEELMGFIRSITHSGGDAAQAWQGDRDMVDLCDIVRNYYYNPKTLGSNSLKFVLPAILQTSEVLKRKYSQPIGKINLTSLHFKADHIWLNEVDGMVANPYKYLPGVFDDWSVEEKKDLVGNIDLINNGGGALMAYAQMQFTDMGKKERAALTQSLLKYCELDTLAMVMLYEHLRELCDE